MKILILEDNETLANGIEKKLNEVGFITDVFYDGEEGLYTLETSIYDLLILDLGLPGIDGIEIIKKLRKSQKNLPILVISARDKLDQRILGLDTGADDYLCKPFELDEVIARVQALLRRSNNQVSNTITYNDLKFDTQTHILLKDEKTIDLSKRELTIFEYLIQNLNAIVSKENIVEHITTIDDEFNPTAVETYISRLRKKLGTSINLKTVRGLGYMMS
ncbi:response regulator transcription factor [Poseidonibacter lekithochrous]|uniref:response regulator transcription factor n=1 Tax=Poseidonibacter TaxID=2321187 RepID=UPI001C0980C5|nr:MULTISPECIES: response regulator transcription factor [Poseidonibacter]MBU3015930.1 response regulator transcription factor [Poseidonibacter lekithochrous]MDO6829229.1 response regulator transcription factor [Poseidonibacter sp. 1_MG-2023]